MQEKSIIKQNILIYLKFIGVTPYKFYKDTGITRGVLTQNNGMSEENTLRFLAHYLDVSAEWLLTGRGQMVKSASGVSERLDVVPLDMEQKSGTSLAVELCFLKESNNLLRDKIALLEQNRILLLREINRLGGDLEKTDIH